MRRPQHQTTAKIAADAKANDLTSYIKQLRMAVNAGNTGRVNKMIDGIEKTLWGKGGDVETEVTMLASYIQQRAEQGINEPLRRCLNVLFGALEIMAELIEG